MSFDRSRIGVVGLLVGGPEAGNFIKILDDIEHSGGILLLTSSNADFSGEVWDNWVGNWRDLDEFLEVNEWQIAWSW